MLNSENLCLADEHILAVLFRRDEVLSSMEKACRYSGKSVPPIRRWGRDDGCVVDRESSNSGGTEWHFAFCAQGKHLGILRELPPIEGGIMPNGPNDQSGANLSSIRSRVTGGESPCNFTDGDSKNGQCYPGGIVESESCVWLILLQSKGPTVSDRNWIREFGTR